MSAHTTSFPRVPLKQMDSSMLVFELDRETQRIMPEHTEMITSAATLASFLHRKQTRHVRAGMPRVPYIEHPLRVAVRLMRWGVCDAELIAAALLHDVVEDCADELVEIFGSPGEPTISCIQRMYGNTITEYVGQVTNPVDGTTYQEHIEHLAATRSAALLIKASDLKDNAGSIQHQLGHGKDQKMLGMVTKYAPILVVVRTGVAALLKDDALAAAANVAIAEIEGLRDTLWAIGEEHQLDL